MWSFTKAKPFWSQLVMVLPPTRAAGQTVIFRFKRAQGKPWVTNRPGGFKPGGCNTLGHWSFPCTSLKEEETYQREEERQYQLLCNAQDFSPSKTLTTFCFVVTSRVWITYSLFLLRMLWTSSYRISPYLYGLGWTDRQTRTQTPKKQVLWNQLFPDRVIHSVTKSFWQLKRALVSDV